MGPPRLQVAWLQLLLHLLITSPNVLSSLIYQGRTPVGHPSPSWFPFIAGKFFNITSSGRTSPGTYPPGHLNGVLCLL